MLNKIALGAIGISLLASPLLTSAQQGSSSRVCPQIVRSLSRGSTGADVMSLQSYLGVIQTGYFGPLTAKAVVQFQASEALPPVGIVGPLTRAAFARRCGNPQPNPNFSASPTAGLAPLVVTFTSVYGDASSYQPSFADGQDTLIDFGDGTDSQWVQCNSMERSLDGRCATPKTIQHTYGKSGTYTAKIKKAGGMCVGGCAETILGTVTITVTNTPNTNQSIKVSAPNGNETYRAGDAIPASWKISGINSSELSNYKIGYRLVPIDASYRPTSIIGSMMSVSPDADVPNTLAGSKSLIAPNGGWWPGSTNPTSADSRYKLLVELGESDPSVCNQTSIPSMPQRVASNGLQIVQPQLLASSPRQCIPYRLVGYDESDGTFIIRQPYVTGVTSNNSSTKQVTATVTVHTPDSCKPFTLEWSTGSIPDSDETVETYTPSSGCSASPYTATYTHTFNFHTSGTYETVGNASLYYNKSFADSFSVPIQSAL